MRQKRRMRPSADAPSTARPVATCCELETADGKLRFAVQLVSGAVRVVRVERSGGLEDTVYIMRFESMRTFESMHDTDDIRFEYPRLHEQLKKTVRALLDTDHHSDRSQHQ